MDMKLHLADPEGMDVGVFEKETLEALKMPKELPMRHRTPHFGHVFSGEGYATAYYGYMWADVLTADAEAFTDSPGGFYDTGMADKLVQYWSHPAMLLTQQRPIVYFVAETLKLKPSCAIADL